MRSAEVVGCPYNPHARLQRRPQTCRRTSPARQLGKPRAEGGLKPLDVGGVDHRRGTALRASEPGSHRGLRATNDAPNHPDHPSPGIPLDRLGDQEPLRRNRTRAPSPRVLRPDRRASRSQSRRSTEMRPCWSRPHSARPEPSTCPASGGHLPAPAELRRSYISGAPNVVIGQDQLPL